MSRHRAPSRFLVDTVPAVGERCTLPRDVAHHLATVLRARTDTPLVLFTGDGGEYAATLTAVDRRRAECRIDGFAPEDRVPSFALELVQGLAKGSKLDLIVQKATELGVHTVSPVVTERSNLKLDGERAAERTAHWARVAASACEQCGRNRLPTVQSPMALQDWLAGFDRETPLLVADTVGTGTPLPKLKEQLKSAGRAALVVGPEGGFSDSERAAFRAAGALPLVLGPRVLRTETAGVVLPALLQCLAGDLVAVS